MSHPFVLPSRVSRLYPLFSLFFLLSSATFFYAWQTARLDLENLPTAIEKNKTLEKNIEQLMADSKLDKATLQVQRQKITDTAAQLANLEKQLATRTQEIASKDQQLKNQKDQLNQNATELEQLRGRPPLFSFQNLSTQADISTQQNEVKSVVSSAYDYIESLYGIPYLLSGIKITFVDEFSIKGSAGEIVITNGSKGVSIDIHLKSFNKNSFQDVNTVIHEVIHGFHGVAVFSSSALEEGMTVAAADAVMERMIADGKLPAFNHLYLTSSDEQYSEWNSQLEVSNDNQTFYSSSNVAKVYQLIGKAWYKLYDQDPEFFKKFNAVYYPEIQHGKDPDNGLVLQSIAKTTLKVGDQDIQAFLNNNTAFHPR